MGYGMGTAAQAEALLRDMGFAPVDDLFRVMALTALFEGQANLSCGDRRGQAALREAGASVALFGHEGFPGKGVGLVSLAGVPERGALFRADNSDFSGLRLHPLPDFFCRLGDAAEALPGEFLTMLGDARRGFGLEHLARLAVPRLARWTRRQLSGKHPAP